MLVHFAIDNGAGFDEPRLGALTQFWLEKRGNRWLPSRSDFDPLELREFLGDLYLVDALEWPKRLRFRLVGTNICKFTGRDVTNRYFDEIYRGAVLRDAMRAQGRAIETAGPARFTGAARLAEKVLIDCEAAVLPLSHDQVRVDMLLCMMVFGQRRYDL